MDDLGMSRVAHTRKKETFWNPHLCEKKKGEKKKGFGTHICAKKRTVGTHICANIKLTRTRSYDNLFKHIFLWSMRKIQNRLLYIQSMYNLMVGRAASVVSLFYLILVGF